MKINWQSLWKLTEKISVIIGIPSAIAGLWALIYPGSVIETLETYEILLQDISGTVQESNELSREVRDNTRVLLEALPKGIRVTEAFIYTQCGEHTEVEVNIILENYRQEAVEAASWKVVGENTSVEEGKIFINAQSQGQVVIKMKERPSYLCVEFRDADGTSSAVEYEVQGWQPLNTCETDSYSQILSAGLRQLEQSFRCSM